MTTVTSIRQMVNPAVQVLRDFEWMDLAGVDGVTAEVEYGLISGHMMSVMAGGPGMHSTPDRPPFTAYEVGFSGDTPRFWRRYTDDVGIIYAHVPRLLISHLVVRSGGIRYSERRTFYREAKKAR